MKKFLLTATMLVCFTAISKAQQGRVGINTTTPSATLDVVATTTDNTRPDALLVPRMTAAQLSAKDDTTPTSAYGAAQNGALVYIVSGTGTGARKAKITGPGFYYFDNTVPEWKPFGGGTAPSSALNVTAEQTTSYTVLPTDDIVLLNITTANLNVTLPTSGIPVGKKLYISNRGSQNVEIIPAPRETTHTVVVAGDAAALIYVGGSGAGSWSYLTGY